MDIFENKNNLLAGSGVPESIIKEAESMLRLDFSDEYRAYLQQYGIAAYNGHELTGITLSPRLDVVAVTLLERTNSVDIPNNLYVIEKTNFENIIVWQNSNGEIFFSGPNQPIMHYCDSLNEYLNDH